MTVQCVIVNKRLAPLMLTARLLAAPYAEAARASPVRETSQSWRFELQPKVAFDPRTWETRRVAKGVSLVGGTLLVPARGNTVG